MDIIRDASDKHKGVKLQKLRAIKLAFDIIIGNPKAQFHIAIESQGDVFIYSDGRKFVEENKNYESKNFSFFTHQVLNTLVYFLDYWLKESVQKSSNVIFSFYSTNSISKEYNTAGTKKLGIELPERPILELLGKKEWNTENDLIEICKKALLSEYERQYKGKNNNYSALEALAEEDWKSFFSNIIWNFEMPANEKLESEISALIKQYALLKKINIDGKEAFIEAMLRKRLEDKQDEDDMTSRYLTDEALELIFYQIANNEISKDIYRYVDFDYSLLIGKIKDFSSAFLKDKYFSINNRDHLPRFLHRNVKKHSPEIRIEASHLRETRPENLKRSATVGSIHSFIDSSQPTFLFGEIGSGKSSIIAQYVIDQNEAGSLSLMVPINFAKGKITSDFASLFDCINNFINSNILIQVPHFDLDFILSNRSCAIVFDGLDELNYSEARNLIRHLAKLSKEYDELSIIATGRPIELQALVRFNEWNCLTTVDLTENEIFEILKNEAIASGQNEENATTDASRRLNFLKSRNELCLLAKTPLIVCLLRDFLQEGVQDETLGTLMYKILSKRLQWDEIDLKENYSNFFSEFPTARQRESIIAAIAEDIFLSETRQIREGKLSQIIAENIQSADSINKVLSEAELFYKNLFLQLNGDFYSFISQPLLEAAYSLKLSSKMCETPFVFDTVDHNWRALSFGIAINRLKGKNKELSANIEAVLKDLLVYDSNIPIAAILVSESKDPKLAEAFITQVSMLEFRPIRTWSEAESWGEPDTYSPFAIAECIFLAGERGFQWYFDEYLDTNHPVQMFEEPQIKAILGSFLFISKFKVSAAQKAKLAGIIPYHLAARTYSCQTFIPLLAAIAPEEFDVKYRCLSLAKQLHHPLFSSRCKQLLLEEIPAGNKSEVLEALEIVIGNREESRIETLLFYLGISDDDQSAINKTILNKIIRSISQGAQQSLVDINKILPKKRLKSYLRYCALTNNEIADSAAILLHTLFKEHDLYLTCRPLLSKTEFYQIRQHDRKKILDALLFDNPQISLDFLLSYIPRRNNNRDEIQEIYIYYLIKILDNIEGIYKHEFLYVITRLPDYPVLSRYPDIRNAFKALLGNKPQYIEFIREASQGLDSRLRFNANSISISCFPENSKSELESVIYSASNRFYDRDEWLRFCTKLNYGDALLEHLKLILDELPELSRYYALYILQHNGANLTAAQTDELLDGLTGNAYFLDIGEPFMPQNEMKRLGQDASFFPNLMTIFNGEDADKSARAADHLISYHYSRLSKFELGKAYALKCESWERELYHFHQYKRNLMMDAGFLEGLDEANKKIRENTGGDSLLQLYKNTVIDRKDQWIELLKKLLYNGQSGDYHTIELFYRWLLTLKKAEPDAALKIAEAAADLKTYPAIIENSKFRGFYPYLVLICIEFSTAGAEEIEDTLENYQCDSELAVALLHRLGRIPEAFAAEKSASSHLTLFAKNSTVRIAKKDRYEIEKIFFDDAVPNNLSEYLESIILFNTYSKEDLAEIERQGKIACFIYSIVKFCYNEDISYATILSAINKIGWPYYRNALTQSFRESLFIIKQKLLSSNESLGYFAAELKKGVDDSKNQISNSVVENMRELFDLQVPIENGYLQILFYELQKTPYMLSLNLMNSIFHFIVNIMEKDDRLLLGIEIDKHIKILTNTYSRRGTGAEIQPLFWMFSLISFYLQKGSNEYSVQAFLKGLESVFVQSDASEFYSGGNKVSKMKGRDLISYSSVIYDKILPEIFQSAVEKGALGGKPETRAICIMLKSFIRT